MNFKQNKKNDAGCSPYLAPRIHVILVELESSIAASVVTTYETPQIEETDGGNVNSDVYIGL